MSDVKPALSPEGWVGARVDGPWDGTQLGPDIYVDPADGRLRVTSRGWIENRHGVAALALHGQPYGFTWEMVDALRWAAEFATGTSATTDYTREQAEKLSAAADRIAALLPPRED